MRRTCAMLHESFVDLRGVFHVLVYFSFFKEMQYISSLVEYVGVCLLLANTWAYYIVYVAKTPNTNSSVGIMFGTCLAFTTEKKGQKIPCSSFLATRRKSRHIRHENVNRNTNRMGIGVARAQVWILSSNSLLGYLLDFVVVCAVISVYCLQIYEKAYSALNDKKYDKRDKK